MNLLIYIFLTFSVIILNRLGGIYANKRGEKLLDQPYKKLPDIIQDYLPSISMNKPDYLLVATILYSITYIDNDLYIYYNTLLLSLTVRPIFVCITTLPTCMPKPKSNSSLYNNFINSTHDLMFSGHTCIFSFCGKLVGGNIGFIFQYLFPISLIMSRQHYTIDVLVAITVYNYFYLTSINYV